MKMVRNQSTKRYLEDKGTGVQMIEYQWYRQLLEDIPWEFFVTINTTKSVTWQEDLQAIHRKIIFQLNKEILKAKYWASDLKFCFVIENYFQSNEIHSHLLITYPNFLKPSEDAGFRDQFEDKQRRKYFEHLLRKVINKQSGVMVDRKLVLNAFDRVKVRDGFKEIYNRSGAIDYVLKDTIKNRLYVDLANFNLNGRHDSSAQKRRKFNVDFNKAKANYQSRFRVVQSEMLQEGLYL